MRVALPGTGLMGAPITRDRPRHARGGLRTKLALNHWVLALTEGVAPERFFEDGAMVAPYAKLKARR